MLALNFLPQTQKISQKYIDDSLQRALVSFTLAKGLNAIISVAQGTEVAATPAGIGVNFAVGEILDPINDMVERFSWVMLASSVSLGIQKILLAVLATLYVQVFLLMLCLLFIYAFFAKKDFLASVSLKLMLFVLVLRFCIPVFALVNQNLYQSFLAPSYETSTQALKNTSTSARELQEVKENPNATLWSKVKKAYQSTADALNIKKKMQELKDKLNHTFSDMLSLITLFIIETIISPLLFLYLLLKLLKSTGLSREKSDTMIEMFRDKVKY